MRELEALDLSGALITDEGLEQISVLSTKLSKLSFNLCGGITSTRSRAFHCRLMLSLHSACSVLSSGKGVNSLVSRMPGLRHLSFLGCHIHGDAVPFNKGNNLESLDLGKCKKISSFSISSKFCVLRELNLASISALTTVVLAVPTLQSLNLSQCTHLARVSLLAPALQNLNISNCIALAELKLENAAADTKLEQINMFGCRSLSIGSFNRMVRGCLPTIEHVTCSGMIQLVDESVQLLLCDEAILLKSVWLDGCKHLQAATLNAVRVRLAHLTDQRVAESRERVKKEKSEGKDGHVPVRRGLPVLDLPVIESLEL